jgi:hypothetical protein
MKAGDESASFIRGAFIDVWKITPEIGKTQSV